MDFASFRVGDWKVYADKGNRGVLTAINAHTKEKRILTNGNARILHVSLGMVYYYDCFMQSTVRVGLSDRIGTAETVTSEHPESLVAIDNYLYYVSSNDHLLYALELGKPEAKLVSSASCIRVKTDGLWVYFVNVSLDYALQRVQAKTTQPVDIIHPGIVSEYELGQGKVFLILPGKGGHIFRMAPDGSEMTELYDGVAYDLHIHNDEVYFRVGPAGRLFKMGLDGSNLAEAPPERR